MAIRERYPCWVHSIDLCCGGDHPLGEALDLHGIERETVLPQIARIIADSSQVRNEAMGRYLVPATLVAAMLAMAMSALAAGLTPYQPGWWREPSAWRFWAGSPR